MEAGKLRHRAAIQYFTETRDSCGDTVKTWATVANRWVEIRPISGKESVNYKAVNSSVTHSIMLRHYDGLTTQHRFYWDSRAFNIDSIMNSEERDEYQVCQCIEA